MTTGTVFVATCDLAGQVRGRATPAALAEHTLRSGVGWVPANLALSCFGELAEDNVFGSVGDLRLIPDPATGIDLPADDRAAPEETFTIRRPPAQPPAARAKACEVSMTPRTFTA